MARPYGQYDTTGATLNSRLLWPVLMKRRRCSGRMTRKPYEGQPPRSQGALSDWPTNWTQYVKQNGDSSVPRSLESSEECDQGCPIPFREVKSKLVALNSIRVRAVRFESGRNVVVTCSARIEPILQSGAPAAMSEHAAIPDAS
jgi:hypothetical protein